MHFETIIGLEVHVELKTDSKMFSPSPAHFGAEPNSNTNVIDLAYPGVLPVVNKRAVDWAMRASMALNMDIATNSKFDRKNYFYPDNPKAYQISQFDEPIGENGYIDIEVDGGINDSTSKYCVERGATMLVTGSYFFKQDDYAKVTNALKG